jgi:TRAP-type mannitol/chloroaromatic compound transport system permease large subunit
MSPELLGGLMLVVMLGAIFIGFPISFTLLLLALIFGWIGLGDKAFYIMVFQTIGLMKEEVLAAVPLFIFMGYLMEQGGLMERLFKGFQLMMGPVPGSLYVGVLITATIFGIAAGTVGATVVLMGIMAVPIMTKNGYNIPMSAGAITAGGTLGILGHGRLGGRALRLVLRPGVPPGRHFHRVLPGPEHHQPAARPAAATRGANR